MARGTSQAEGIAEPNLYSQERILFISTNIKHWHTEHGGRIRAARNMGPGQEES